MQQLSRRTFLELASLASVGLIGGCGEGTSITGAGNFSIPVFSDVHFQPFIAPAAPTAETLAANAALVAQLDAADASQWPAILLGPANTLNFPLSAPGADTNYTLMALALASIRQNLGTSPAVLFTGDFLGHSLYQLYLEYSVNKTDADAAAFVDKTLAFVLQLIRAAVGAIPVYFALGNCDSYTGHGPNNTFLENNARSLYSLGLNGTGNQQDVIGSITNGGYYAVEPAGMNLMIIALNTIALSPSVTADSTMIAAQFKWLDAKLAAANTTGKKVWLLMHAPPGVDEATTGEPGNDNGQIATATMMWVSANQTKFLGIIQKYPGVIAMSLAGHTHMDEFRLMTTGNTLAITAGISPVFGNNPAYKIFSMDRLSLAPNDYSAVNCNLLVTPSNFNNYYTFSQAYDLKGPLAPSLARLFPMLHASNGAQEQYQGAFHSGNNTSNPITTTNWPVYWCGIGFMDQQEFFTAVNRF